MIIISQDKDVIVNFDKVHDLWIDDNLLDKTECEYEILADDETLGYYKTEKRAREVLQDIMNIASLKLNTTMHGTAEEINLKLRIQKMMRYEMPKE